MAEIKIIVRDVGTEIEFEIVADENLPENEDDWTSAQQLALDMVEHALKNITPVGPKPEEPSQN